MILENVPDLFGMGYAISSSGFSLVSVYSLYGRSSTSMACPTNRAEIGNGKADDFKRTSTFEFTVNLALS